MSKTRRVGSGRPEHGVGARSGLFCDLPRYSPAVRRLWDRIDLKWHAHASELACLFAALALMFGLVATIQRIELHNRHLWINWGTVPDWLAAIGGVATVAALVVAWAVYRHSVRARREDEQQRLISCPHFAHNLLQVTGIWRYPQV